MTGVITFLIIFFLLLILYQIFLANIERVVEGMETAGDTSTKDATTVKKVTVPANVVSSNIISPPHPTTINATNINSINPSYMPYSSNSENILSFVEQNANNISFLKNNLDNLYQQVQDISGNMTTIDNKVDATSSRATQVNSILDQAQSAMPKSPPKVKGTSQSPKTLAQVTSIASGVK